jgi:formylglycine-generating enzyme required for sulfatase activity
MTIDCTFANYGGSSWPSTACTDAGANKVGSESPKGDGKWGHADLAGNVWEWNADWLASALVSPCVDCAYLTPTATGRTTLGGGLTTVAAQALTSYRTFGTVTKRFIDTGFRCARTP